MKVLIIEDEKALSASIFTYSIQSNTFAKLQPIIFGDDQGR
jgi:hypothetical protein